VVLLWLVLAALLTSGLSGCAGREDTVIEDKLIVMVSIVPQAYCVERIAGEHVTVDVMVLPGNSPETYEPKPEQLKALSSAVAYFGIGVPFEDKWLDRIAEANPDMIIVDTIAEVERLPMTAPHSHDDEGDDGEHEEEEYVEGAPDPHVWLSPELVKVQSQAIYEALAQLNPEHRDTFKANLDGFNADIDELESDINATLSGLNSNKLMVFHPAWGYFAHDFGLEQIAIEVGGQESSAREMAHLIEEAQEENIQVVFAQPEFSTKAAETIAQEIGSEVLLISPLTRDWLAHMRLVSETFADVLNRQSP
jgi:zinc transport system substrate-binding protein